MVDAVGPDDAALDGGSHYHGEDERLAVDHDGDFDDLVDGHLGAVCCAQAVFGLVDGLHGDAQGSEPSQVARRQDAGLGAAVVQDPDDGAREAGVATKIDEGSRADERAVVLLLLCLLGW